MTRLYRSTDAKVDAGDQLLGQFAAPGLVPNATSSGSVTITLPAGTFYFIAVCDAANSVIESRETNNLKKAQKTIP